MVQPQRAPLTSEPAPDRVDERTERAAMALGGVSLGLGVLQVAVPRRLARAVGLSGSHRHGLLLRAVGLRELGAAGALLADRDRALGLWSRVGGDAMDLAMLGLAMSHRDNKRGRLVLASAVVAGITAADVIAALGVRSRYESEQPNGDPTMTHTHAAVTVRRPVDEVYRAWRDVERFPEFMTHVREVRALDATRSHWVVDAPAGRSIEWDAEIVDDRPGEFIVWRSIEGSPVQHEGTVRFRRAPADQGTEIAVHLRHRVPAGSLGHAVATLLGESPAQQVSDDLRRFKQLVETGAVVVSDASPEGVRTTRLTRQRAAQPVG